MYKIVKKRVLAPQVVLMDIDAPLIAKKAEPGQFIMFRIDEAGERVPLTIADYDREKGTVTIIFQEIGKSTKKLGQMSEGEGILDFVGPLGVASHLEGLGKVAVVGGGLGTAIAYPQAKKLKTLGAQVDVIMGFRNQESIILEEEMAAVSNRLFVTTDDGSNGNKGFVTDELKKLLDAGETYDLVIAIGPLVMMRAVCALTKEAGIKTIVSMNSIMIDGTGMCGCCRLTVNGETKFACVDGPEFIGHEVDFDEAIARQDMYREEERVSLEHHECRLGKLAEKE
ncbi:MAG: sulfide/dihydroorotate dehydrogenase-like FAD/NAD-binding protein [Dehalobacterium sp.]|jgi:ferredoxin--NADP+ reductase